MLKKSMVTYGSITLYAIMIGEMVTRLFLSNNFPLVIFDVQLILIGACLVFETVHFQRVSNRLFDGDFKKEQFYFKVSLFMFISTYALRTLTIMAITIWFDTYIEWYREKPMLLTSFQLLDHMVYDLLPVIHIMIQHNKTLDEEKASETNAVMDHNSIKLSMIRDNTTFLDTIYETQKDSSHLMTIRKLGDLSAVTDSNIRMSYETEKTYDEE